MNSRGVHRRSHAHPVVDDVHNDLGDGSDDLRATGRSQHEPELTGGVDHDRRSHRRQGPSFWRDEVALALHEAELVSVTNAHREVVHLVVEEKPGAANDHTGAISGIDRVRQRHGVALGVDDRVVRRVGPLRDGNAVELLGRGCTAPRDGRSQLAGVFVARQSLDGHFHEVGIAQIVVAVGEGAAEALRHQVNRLHGVPAGPPNIVAFEDVQDLGERDTARRGRRHGDDRIAAIVEHDRIPPHRSVAAQIFVTDETPARSHLADDEIGGAAPVEGVFAFLRDQSQGLGEQRLAESASDARGCSPREEDLLCRLVLHQPLGPRRQALVHPLGKGKTVLSQIDRRGEEICPGL